MDITAIAILLLFVEAGRRKGLLASSGLLLVFFPLRLLSYRTAVLIHDLLVSNIKGILDYKLAWTESAFQGLASGQAAYFDRGIRLLTEHPQIRAILTAEWFEGMDAAFIKTMGGMDRLSDLNLIQVEAFWILLMLLGLSFYGLCKLTRKMEVDRAGRLGGAVVLSLVALLIVYQALVAAAPSIWMVPDSSLARWMEGSQLITMLLWNNPLMWN